MVRKAKKQRLATIWSRFQTTIFPCLQEELGEFTNQQRPLIEVLEIAQIKAHFPKAHFPYVGRVPGRPQKDRCAIARAFIAKAIYNMARTQMLLDRLRCDLRLRRIYGWEQSREVPGGATFSRAFTEFSEYEYT